MNKTKPPRQVQAKTDIYALEAIRVDKWSEEDILAWCEGSAIHEWDERTRFRNHHTHRDLHVPINQNSLFESDEDDTIVVSGWDWIVSYSNGTYKVFDNDLFRSLFDIAPAGPKRDFDSGKKVRI